MTPPEVFLGAQFDLGLAWVHFPEGDGGLGLSPRLMNVVNARLGEAKAPSPYGRNPIGYGMGAPTVVTHGSDVQKKRYLRPLFTGEEVWCQLFSEPVPAATSRARRLFRWANERGCHRQRCGPRWHTSHGSACSSLMNPDAPSTRA